MTARRACSLSGIAAALGAAILCGHLMTARAGGEGARAAFEARYAAWQERLLRQFSLSSDGDYESSFGNDEFRSLVALGPAAVPCMVDKVRGDHMLGHALGRITKVRYHIVREGSGPREWRWHVEELPDIVGETGPPDWRTIWQRWWTEDRHRAGEKLQSLYGECEQAKAAGEQAKADRALERIEDVGIAVLPAMMGKIAEGATNLMPVASRLKGGGIAVAASADTVATWWAANKEGWTLPEK